MKFENDPIADLAAKEVRDLRHKGVVIEAGAQYNRVFEAFYNLHQKLNAPAPLPPSDEEQGKEIERWSDYHDLVKRAKAWWEDGITYLQALDLSKKYSSPLPVTNEYIVIMYLKEHDDAPLRTPTNQAEPGNKWVKASERIPELDKNVFVRLTQSKDKYLGKFSDTEDEGILFFTIQGSTHPNEKFQFIEWLDESPLPESSQKGESEVREEDLVTCPKCRMAAHPVFGVKCASGECPGKSAIESINNKKD